MHADTWVHENDRQSLERLCRPGARGPLALERLSRREDGKPHPGSTPRGERGRASWSARAPVAAVAYRSRGARISRTKVSNVVGVVVSVVRCSVGR